MGVKPMNCPGHAHLFSLQRHSYRELPVRYSEPGLLHRNEASGVLHGLLRVRHFARTTRTSSAPRIRCTTR